MAHGFMDQWRCYRLFVGGRDCQTFFAQAGIRSVPAIIINRRHLISGGQPVEVFERALRDIAAGVDAA